MLGAVAELKKMVRQLGDDAFGPPDARTAAAIERLEDLPRLEEILRRVRTAGSWQELFGAAAVPPPGRPEAGALDDGNIRRAVGVSPRMRPIEAPEARELLQALTKGAMDSPLTRDAMAAPGRLDARAAP